MEKASVDWARVFLILLVLMVPEGVAEADETGIKSYSAATFLNGKANCPLVQSRGKHQLYGGEAQQTAAFSLNLRPTPQEGIYSHLIL